MKKNPIIQWEAHEQLMIWLCHLFQEAQAALTGVPRVKCQATRKTRHTVTPSLISVTPCHRSMPHSHATATRLRRSTGSCGSGLRRRRKRRRSASWNVWRERKKAAKAATGAGRAVQETCGLPTPSVEKCSLTPTPSASTTKPGQHQVCFTSDSIHTHKLQCSLL